MKKNDTTFKKTVSVIGLICGIAYFVLSGFNLFDLTEIPKVFLFPLSSTYLASLGFTLKDRKIAKWFYLLAAAYFLLALLYLIF